MLPVIGVEEAPSKIRATDERLCEERLVAAPKGARIIRVGLPRVDLRAHPQKKKLNVSLWWLRSKVF